MSDYQPKYDPGDNFPLIISGTVIGGRLVDGTGAHAGADSTTSIGVTRQDGVAGDQVTVTTARVQRLLTTAAVAKGAGVKCAAAGQIVTYTPGTDSPDKRVGTALEATAGAGVIAVRMDR